MTVVVTHTTPADGTFSATGAAAWNADHALVGVGTMAEQDANNVAVTGGNINNTVIGNTTPNAATFTTLTSSGLTTLTNGSGSLIIDDGGGSIANFRLIGPTGALGRTRLYSPNQLRISAATTNSINFYTGASSTPSGDGVLQLQVSNTTSAVNYVQVTGAATNNRPTASSQGSDTDIGFNIVTKGSGTHNFASDANIGTSQFQVTRTQASAVNYLTATGAATNFSPRLFAAGSDTNISQVFQSKGTGAIDLAAGSSGVNISNGGTVTAITRTAGGSDYTSFPAIAISAPATAGGVQATASVTAAAAVNAAVVVSGGTGYAVGNVLTPVGGTGGVGTQITVNAVSGGVITSASITANAPYTVLPTNPVSVTGGGGTGATFNLNYAISAITITNAGSGYVEQPTVTFSGGGGSGAAAYASVGGDATIKALGQIFNLATDNGVGFRVVTTGQQNPAYWQALGTASNAILRSTGATLGSQINTSGTGGLFLGTNGGVSQLVVAHTASAVNYVQVTGSATGNRPVILPQGSDTNIGLNLQTKGTGAFFFATGGSGSAQFVVANTSSSVNYVQVTGAVTTGSPTISALGNDTNIDLALTPKGTGNVRFGTYTANMALTIQGYVEIKDSGGTIRRLAVIA